MRFTFTGTDSASKTTLEFTAISLSEVLENFERFLTGCGYSLKGYLDVVEHEEYEEEHGGQESNASNAPNAPNESDLFTSGDQLDFAEIERACERVRENVRGNVRLASTLASKGERNGQ